MDKDKKSNQPPDKISAKELSERQALTLNQKIDHSFGVIEEFYKKMNGKVYVAFSGGKDSTVLLHLVRRWMKMIGKPDVPAVFSDTSNEQQQIVKFVKFIDNIIIIKPKMTFLQTIEKYGYPLVSKKISRMIHDLKNKNDKNKNITNLYLTGYNKFGQYCRNFVLSKKWYPLLDAPFKISNKCCEELKRKPFHKFEKETGMRGFIGTMADESVLRRTNYIKYGCNIFTAKEQKSRPLSIWTEKDIWEYIKKYNVPYCEVYDKQIIDGVELEGDQRTGCAYCGFGVHLEKGDQNRFFKLYKREPKRYKYVMDELGFRKVLKYINIKLPDDSEYDCKDYPVCMDAYKNGPKIKKEIN